MPEANETQANPNPAAAATAAPPPPDLNAPPVDLTKPAEGEGDGVLATESVVAAPAPTYNDHPVTILRAATEADFGFIPHNAPQLLIQFEDGSRQVVFADKVANPAT